MNGVKALGYPGIVLAIAAALWLGRVEPLPPVAFSTQAAAGRDWGLRLAGPRVVVLGVAPGTAADAAGIQPGDVIVAVQDQCVASPRQVTEILDSAPRGGSIMVELLRSGSHVVLALK